MDITISENLKEYRRNKENTQEALAEYVGISVQAVSKWERGESYPDITLLPKIATYYNVCVDDLLGVGKIHQSNKIEEYRSKAKECSDVGDKEGVRKIWQEAIKEFPHDLSVIHSYMRVLPDDNEKDAYEKIRLAEELIRGSTETENYTFSATQVLCFAYKKLGNIEKAKEYANSLPIYYMTQSQLMMGLLEGEEAVKHIQNNIIMLTDLIWLNAINLVYMGKFSTEEKIYIHNCVLKVYESVYGEDLGFNYDRTAILHRKIAEDYAEVNNLEETLQPLAISAEHRIKWCSLSSDGVYTSPLVNRQGYDVKHSKGDIEILIKHMQENIFDFCRGTDKFNEIQKELEKYT